MKYSYQQVLSILRHSLSILNFVIILFYSMLILMTTQYIVQIQYAREFLDRITHLPQHPLVTFLGSISLYAVLIFVIYNRNTTKVLYKMNVFYSFLEVLIGFLLIYFLYMSYNGVLFLIFCDSIFNLKQEKYSKGLLGVLIIVYIISSYDVFSIFVPMTNMFEYFQIYGSQVNGVLMIITSCLEMLNIILFIAFMIVYLADEMRQNQYISEELDMVNQVNKELQNYAAITEKIGENKERKRLAREIHDTLGHALTGIAAGVDACIAMIDQNPTATKQQLQVISKVVRQGITDVRNSLNKLRPGALEEHGFKEALERMIAEFSSVSDLTIELDYQLEDIDLEKTDEDIIFRIIQESITNALRHGHATEVKINMHYDKNFLHLKIKDNGIGCDDVHFGFGLTQMKERLAMINGEVHFDGHQGFLTEVTLPRKERDKHD